ncbi:MAG: hypothetical protein HKN26_11555 [Acidimicrobiales bacterium]|nr:hypothetical protein [Acidimicrobiales bacterium]
MRFCRLIALVALALLAASCTRGDSAEIVLVGFEPQLDAAMHLEPPVAEPIPEPGVTVLSPAEGTVVVSPVTLTLEVQADELDPIERQVHTFVDEPCAAPGDSVPINTSRTRLGPDENTVEVEVDTGFHSICVLFIDATGRASAATDTISVAVVPPDSPAAPG